MTGVLLDTSAYSALRRGLPAVLELVRNSDEIVLTPIVLGELRAGFLGGLRPQENERILRRFLSSQRVRVVSIDQQTSAHYAEIKGALKAAGTPIPANEVWIAASAAQHGLPVVTLDQHFERIAAIRVQRL